MLEFKRWSTWAINLGQMDSVFICDGQDRSRGRFINHWASRAVASFLSDGASDGYFSCHSLSQLVHLNNVATIRGAVRLFNATLGFAIDVIRLPSKGNIAPKTFSPFMDTSRVKGTLGAFSRGGQIEKSLKLISR